MAQGQADHQVDHLGPAGPRRADHPSGVMPVPVPTARVMVTVQRPEMVCAMSANTQESSNFPEFRTGPLITSAALVGAGAMIALAGLAVGGSHLISATRRWVQAMEVPPSEVAKAKWAQARTAAVAGTAAWRNGVSADVGS